MWGVDKMKIRWTNQAEEQQAEVFFEKGRATPENFRKLGKKRGGDCRIVVKKEGFSKEEWIQMLCNGVCSLYDGAYQFSRNGVKMLGKQKVYENRDSLCDYGDTCYTFVLEGSAQEIAALERGELLGRCKGHARTLGNLPNNYLHGVNIRGKLLFDYHAMPFTRMPLLEVPGEELVLVREGYSEGGENPNGWSAKTMPYLMEYDNWGGLVVDDRENIPREELAWRDWWGYDQIAWFANQPEEGRNHFLEYTYKWTEINNPNAYFELPFRRMIHNAEVSMKRADNGQMDAQDFYQINTKSAACPMGFDQEETAKRLWATGHTLREKAANPEMLIRYGAENVCDEETGMKLPEKIVVYGSFQSHVGAVKNDSNSELTRMYYIGDNTYTLSVVIPFAGTYDYSISTYGTLSATYQADGYPRSGSSNKAYFTTRKDNTVVRFRYQFISNKVTIEMFE